MKRMKIVMMLVCVVVLTVSCRLGDSEGTKEMKMVEKQQSQYAIGQPIPTFEWSFERHLMIHLYQLRNMKVATHSVWRSNTGFIEGDCPSLGFGLPYDVSLTNPLMTTDEDQQGHGGAALVTVEQPEPNGIFASKNTNATWVMCTGDAGNIEPIYVESRVTGYPYSVKVDYTTNRVTKVGKASVTISIK